MEEEGSDWLNTFFTFLYGLVNPPDTVEEEEEDRGPRESRASRHSVDHWGEEDDEDEEEQTTRAKHDGKPNQKVVIVGLQNQ